MTTIARALASLTMAVALACGCSHTVFYKTMDGADKLQPVQRDSAASGSITVHLDAPRDLSCLMRKPEGERLARSTLTCHDSDTIATARGVLDNQVKSDEDVIWAMVFEDFAAVLRKRLEAHLARHFEEVKVTTRDIADADADVEASLLYHTKSSRFSLRSATIQLQVKDDERLVAEGEHNQSMSSGVLGWYIPVALLVPVGTIAAVSILQGVDKNLHASIVASAIDEAASQMADRLADRDSLPPKKRTPSKPVAVVAPEPDPEPEPEPQPVVAEPEPEPKPVVAEPEPEPEPEVRRQRAPEPEPSPEVLGSDLDASQTASLDQGSAGNRGWVTGAIATGAAAAVLYTTSHAVRRGFENNPTKAKMNITNASYVGSLGFAIAGSSFGVVAIVKGRKD